MSGRNRRRSKPQQGRRRRGPKQRDPLEFWGEAERVPPVGAGVRITEEPAAVVRSLGPPPLPGHETIAEHYFDVVYDQAVLLSGALAAAGGLIPPEELEELADS